MPFRAEFRVVVGFEHVPFDADCGEGDGDGETREGKAGHAQTEGLFQVGFLLRGGGGVAVVEEGGERGEEAICRAVSE